MRQRTFRSLQLHVSTNIGLACLWVDDDLAMMVVREPSLEPRYVSSPIRNRPINYAEEIGTTPAPERREQTEIKHRG